MRKALDSDSKKVSSELSSDFQKLFLQCNECIMSKVFLASNFEQHAFILNKRRSFINLLLNLRVSRPTLHICFCSRCSLNCSSHLGKQNLIPGLHFSEESCFC